LLRGAAAGSRTPETGRGPALGIPRPTAPPCPGGRGGPSEPWMTSVGALTSPSRDRTSPAPSRSRWLGALAPRLGVRVTIRRAASRTAASSKELDPAYGR